jgi:hypothetical protein
VLAIDKERSLLVDGSSKISVKNLRVIAGNLAGERVPRIEGRVVTTGEDLAVDLVRARLGENFNSSIAQRIVLRGKGILIDADFANGGFGG